MSGKYAYSKLQQFCIACFMRMAGYKVPLCSLQASNMNYRHQRNYVSLHSARKCTVRGYAARAQVKVLMIKYKLAQR
jgi:hypothetical protein